MGASGTKWKCNLCDRVIDLPADFDYDMAKRRTVERADRPELNSAVVEYIAPPEYCVRHFDHDVYRAAHVAKARPPQPVSFMFLVDVSATAVKSGFSLLLPSFVRVIAIQECWLRSAKR